MKISGIHHITAISGPPQGNYDFYTGILGLRLVKKTVNFDDPGTYHLYYGNETGLPGTLLTFFPFERAHQGKTGTGMAGRIGFAVPEKSFDWWVEHVTGKTERYNPPSERFSRPVFTFMDPDGLMLEIIPMPDVEKLPGWDSDPVSREHSIRSFANVTLLSEDADRTSKLLEIMGYEQSGEDGIFRRFKANTVTRASENGNHPAVAPYVDLQIQQSTSAHMGKGTIHHVAFRAKDEEEQMYWREEFIKAGLYPTEVVDRQYFKSIYFREPGGVLFEMATDSPGMLIDESSERLGSSLCLPKWFESRRDQIEARLPGLSSE